MIIDRFEGEYAVVENDNKEMVNIPRSLLSEGCSEGSVIVLADDGTYKFDEEATLKRQERIKKLRRKLNR